MPILMPTSDVRRVRIAALALLMATRAAAGEAQIIKSRPARFTDLLVGGLSGFVGLPVGEFQKNEDGGFGGEVMAGVQPFRGQPLVLRANALMFQYGRYDHDVEEEFCGGVDGECETETVFYDSRHHNMFALHVGPEVMATHGTWRPFAFAQAGITFFRSTSSYGNAYADPLHLTLLSSHNMSAGYGIGIRNVSKRFGREQGFELSVRLIRNARATWANDAVLRSRGNGTWDVTPRLGAANVLTIQVGAWGGPYVNW